MGMIDELEHNKLHIAKITERLSDQSLKDGQRRLLEKQRDQLRADVAKATQWIESAGGNVDK